MRQYYHRNQLVTCKVTEYIPKERTFEVVDVKTNVRGKVIFTNNYQNIPKMKNAYQQGINIDLYFDRNDKGVNLFSYNIKENTPSINKGYPECQEDLTITVDFSSDNRENNEDLFNMIFQSLGQIIDSNEKYKIAKQLIKVNKKYRFRKLLAKEIFCMSTAAYQNQFWSEGLLPYFSNYSIKNNWDSADKEAKIQILRKLGISDDLNVSGEIKIETYFSNLESITVQYINSAERSIHICMSWFTNYNIFKALKNKLCEGLDICLITNNDEINNGGYCLNLNELIENGIRLHLAEYPEYLNHKFCIVDEKTVLTGSYNWTFFSENRNRESLVIIKDANAVNSFSLEMNTCQELYPRVDRMPDNVPEKPKFDRRAFKVYITEENHNSYAFNLYRPRNNSALTTKQLEQRAGELAIAERATNLSELKSHRDKLNDTHTQLKQEYEELRKQRESLENKISCNSGNENSIDGNIDEANKRFDELTQKEDEINSNILDAEQEREKIEHEIATVESEIATIKNYSDVETQGGRGSLKINLKWNTLDDLDLHVFDPDGQEICYSDKTKNCQGVNGTLDVDANAGGARTKDPQENIFWEENKDAPLGRYKVCVNFYARYDMTQDVPYTISVYPALGEPKVIPGIIKNVKETQKVIEFDYTKDGIKYISE